MSAVIAVLADVWSQIDDVQCDYSSHRGDHPVRWAVWTTGTGPCGCPVRTFMYYCQPCWARRNSRGMAQCRRCQAIVPAMENVIDVKPVEARR